MTSSLSPATILALPLIPLDPRSGGYALGGATTVRGFLVALLDRLWEDGETFSGKRPFGDSGWEYQLIAPLVSAGLITGTLDEYGSPVGVDWAAGRQLIRAAIGAMVGPEDVPKWNVTDPEGHRLTKPRSATTSGILVIGEDFGVGRG